jgi:RNA polymerase sigma-70 factor, ECF subfamily
MSDNPTSIKNYLKEDVENGKQVTNSLKNVIRRRIKNENKVDDIFQNFYVNVLSHKNTFNKEFKPDKIKAWLYAIVRNCTIDYLRKEYRQKGKEKNEEYRESKKFFQESVLEEVIKKEDLENVKRAYELVLEEAREISPLIGIPFLDQNELGLSYEEISKKEGICIGTVRSRLYNARERIRKNMTNKYL